MLSVLIVNVIVKNDLSAGNVERYGPHGANAVTSPHTDTTLSANLKTRLLLEAAQFPWQRLSYKPLVGVWVFLPQETASGLAKSCCFEKKKREKKKNGSKCRTYASLCIFIWMR